MRTWSRGRSSFKGFDKNFDTHHQIVLTVSNGSIEIWALDGTKGFNELNLKYYEPETAVIGRYLPEGFRGVLVEDDNRCYGIY